MIGNGGGCCWPVSEVRDVVYRSKKRWLRMRNYAPVGKEYFFSKFTYNRL